MRAAGTSSLEFLLDPDFLGLRSFPKIPVPGYPSFERFPLPSANAETDTLERFESLFVPDFVARYPLGGAQMALCNKRTPHSLTDTMLIQSDADVRSRFCDLSPAQKSLVLAAGREFVRFVSDPTVAERYGLRGGYVHLTYNTSAETGDRENGMGYTKRFHLHLNFWRACEFEGANESTLGNLPRSTRMELLDPFTPLASEIIVHRLRSRGALARYRTLDVRNEDAVNFGLPPGVAIQLPGWETLTEPGFQNELEDLQQVVFDCFTELQVAFTGRSEPAPAWTRHPLLDPEAIDRNLARIDLPDGARPLLHRLARTLRSITPQHGAFFRRNKSLRVRNMLMNGANFSVGFISMAPNLEPLPVEASRRVWLILQVKMLSTMGSAGIFSNGLAPIIRIARNARNFSPEEEELRFRFQQEFAARLASA